MTDRDQLVKMVTELYERAGNEGCEPFWYDPDYVPKAPAQHEGKALR